MKRLLRKIKKINQLYWKNLSTKSPEEASKKLYKKYFNKELDLNNPVTLNEKLMWLKLNTYCDNDLITTCVDKYKVREYLKEKKCESILNELIAVWENVDEINWDELPEKFVLKCNHGAGFNIVCEDKSKFDIKSAERTLNGWMKLDFWKIYAETNYKHVPKRIICEKFIETESGSLPDDYKIYCFNGKPSYVMLCTGREHGKPSFYYFDRDWNLMPYTKDAIKNPNFTYNKPEGIDEMFEYAKHLSKPFPFVRTDFYLEKGKLIFGELTFTPGAALDNDRLEEVDIILGNHLDLK